MRNDVRRGGNMANLSALDFRLYALASRRGGKAKVVTFPGKVEATLGLIIFLASYINQGTSSVRQEVLQGLESWELTLF